MTEIWKSINKHNKGLGDISYILRRKDDIKNKVTAHFRFETFKLQFSGI